MFHSFLKYSIIVGEFDENNGKIVSINSRIKSIPCALNRSYDINVFTIHTRNDGLHFERERDGFDRTHSKRGRPSDCVDTPFESLRKEVKSQKDVDKIFTIIHALSR